MVDKRWVEIVQKINSLGVGFLVEMAWADFFEARMAHGPEPLAQ